jgi:hypothetical protein
MNETKEILQIIGCGLLGIFLAMFFKMQDITNANENLNFKQVAALFFKKCWASYGASITTVLIYAITHENWATLFTGENESASHSLISRLIGMVMLMGVFIGFLAQYGAYRFLLPKIDKALKVWGGEPAAPEQVAEEKKDN